ncbi:oogenesis-related [Fundulus heteroclitus]|uniref:oogenesis-related n=1 Tax=Fundulus heteroclitus TaxID=8078 RepID=UPI00165A2B21|nr:oogenesis-related [Fundulus heteroclitus]
MSCEPPREAVEQPESPEGRVVRRDGVLRSLVRGLFWPFSIVVRAYRGFWWVLGHTPPPEEPLSGPVASSPARQSLTGRKRLYWATRLLLRILPRWAQAALGYPVCSNIGSAVSPEISISPTKPCGKGSKRKQDELDEEDQPSWVEVLSKELPDEGSEEDPDYEVSTEETDSEEYASKNDTESDLEVPGKGIVIRDVDTDVAVIMPDEGSKAAV